MSRWEGTLAELGGEGGWGRRLGMAVPESMAPDVSKGLVQAGH